ncbi:BTB/POZ domain-containing protein 17-like isoform X1 [Scyliorhinus canicula]|uniref:BTB/POZ domain-containing protein 17-like isoform X1 n=2 Tax=Scyliorhinus canicula TaxID=7830 RepID=UPI0018F65289|nr:BTB/POZ domain-containing protein 17-like isoform X1 [Scyliorhinus canicula]
MGRQRMDGSEASETFVHQTHIMSALSSLFKSEELCDVRLSINGGSPLPAHRFVLALGSAVFRAMLSGERWADGRRGTVELTEEEGAAACFEDFLRYFYTGRIAVNVDNVFAVHGLAEKYDVGPLRIACEQFLLDNVAHAGALDLALAWHRYARFVGFTRLEEACDTFVAWNLDTVMRSPDWLALDEEQMDALLRRSDLVVESEFALCQALLRWLERRPDAAAPNLLAHLRFPMMSPDELASLRVDPLAPRQLLDDLLAQSLGLHQDSCLTKENVGRLHAAPACPLRQRLYTAKSCGSPWQLDFFSSMTKTVLCKEFATTNFRVQSKWFVTFHPKGERLVVQEERPVRGSVRLPAPPGAKRRCTCPGLYERVLKDNNRAALHCKIIRCHSSSRATHEHQIAVLFYRFLAGRWLVCDLKTFNIPHWQDVKIDDLLPASERGKYVSRVNDTMTLHFIGQTNWKKI